MSKSASRLARYGIAAFAAAALWAPGSASALSDASCIDKEANHPLAEMGGGQEIATTVKSLQGGYLFQVHLWVSNEDQQGGPWIVRIRDVSLDGVPTNTVLAQKVVTGAEVPEASAGSSARMVVNFNTPVVVPVGDTYAISLDEGPYGTALWVYQGIYQGPPAPCSNHEVYTGGGAYPFKRAFLNPDSVDVKFNAFVGETPAGPPPTTTTPTTTPPTKTTAKKKMKKKKKRKK